MRGITGARMNLQSELQHLINSQTVALVVGLGISGVEAARFLRRIGVRVRCVEREVEERYQQKSKFREEIEGLRALGVEVYFGVDGERVAPLLEGVHLAVVSPGVPLESAICGALSRQRVPLISELELGVEVLGIPAVGVTGSNGKSTTVTLIHHILTAAGFRATLCGNVGTPVVRSAERGDVFGQRRSPGEILVVEASSYQLESCRVIRPKVAVFLNLSENHLERHGSMERYWAAKARLFAQQDETDFAVVNTDDPRGRELAASTRGKILHFGTEPYSGRAVGSALIEYDPRAGRDLLVVRGFGAPERYELSACHLLGAHNRYNIAAAVLSTRALGVDVPVVQAAILSFFGLEHRIEVVAEPVANGGIPRRIILNDSKSTTVAATVAALATAFESYPQATLSLLIGGQAKAGSWDPLLSRLESRSASIAPVICFGKDGALLAQHCAARGVPHEIAATLREATERVLTRPVAGASRAPGAPEPTPQEVILFSPGCASFDEFTDFEHRGSMFKSYIHGRAER